ncbi:MAG: MBOAT family protein [Phycisphaeraceae bacterium]|nr:MAG: MBOAT family protein [Phycisphaeraceae bacterium]
MLFHSWVFWSYFVLVYLAYLRLGRRGQNLLLLGASYLFYAAWDWRFCGLLLVSTVVDFWAGHRIATSEGRRRRVYLLISLVTNLGLLGFFKYFDFFAKSMAAMLAHFDIQASPVLLNVILPVGISFYTFQTLSYSIDVYRGVTKHTRNPLDFALYVSFFPQLVAGPIERSDRLLPQIEHERRLTHDHLRQGFWWILYGMFMKVAVADNLSVYADGLFGDPAPQGFEVWTRVLAFTFQIYGDFAGYSAIARGVASLMGFSLMVNFDAPYLSSSPSEFWRRWHISLSTWLRDYLYIPLGGNRGGVIGTCRNLALTMLLGGLWHGAGWNFVLWGAYQGALLMIYRVVQRPVVRAVDRFMGSDPATPTAPVPAAARHVLRWIMTLFFFLLTIYGWLLFRCHSWEQIVTLTRAGLDLNALWEARDANLLATIAVLIAPVLLLDALNYRTGSVDFVLRWPKAVRWLFYAAMGAWIFLLGHRGGEAFIYFQF